jgi:hypothetical protein
MRTVVADKGPAPADPYSHVVVANGFVFVSGQGAVNPETGNMPDAFADQVLPKPFERIESLRSILSFRVPLGAGAHELEVLRQKSGIPERRAWPSEPWSGRAVSLRWKLRSRHAGSASKRSIGVDE